MHRASSREVLLSAFLVIAVSCIARGGDPIDIGSRRELFVDRLLIERVDGVELRLHHPVKAPRPESPLPTAHYVTVIKDADENGDLFRAWWRGSDPSFTGERHTGHAGETVEYAESRDGHEWTFPEFGFHEIGGSRENNVILANMPPLLTNFTPFLDTRPGVPRHERFKALAGYPGPGDKRGRAEPGYGTVRFRFRRRHQLGKAKTKSFPTGMNGGTRLIHRMCHSGPKLRNSMSVIFARGPQRTGCAVSVRTTSRDFQTWTAPAAMNPNRPGEHLYTNQTHPYFRAPHIYIALPTRFVPDRGGAPEYDVNDNNATDILMMSSRAGSERYDRVFTHAFIRPGLEPSRWKNRANYAALNVVPTSPTEMSIYHRSGDRYVIRTDGFVSVHADSQSGELLTRPLKYSGETLYVNLSTSAAGSMRCELQTADGRPVPGFRLNESHPAFGDSIEMELTWNNAPDLSAWAETPVRLRFVMNECDLYSFHFE